MVGTMTHKYYFELEIHNKLHNGIFNASSDDEALEILSRDVSTSSYILVQNIDSEPVTIFDRDCCVCSLHPKDNV